MMDDFNKDKVVSKDDAVALAGVLESLAKTAELSSFIGGIGIYGSTPLTGRSCTWIPVRGGPVGEASRIFDFQFRLP